VPDHARSGERDRDGGRAVGGAGVLNRTAVDGDPEAIADGLRDRRPAEGDRRGDVGIRRRRDELRRGLRAVGRRGDGQIARRGCERRAAVREVCSDIPGGRTAGQIDGGGGGLRGRGDRGGGAGAGDPEVVRRGVRDRRPAEVDGAGQVGGAGGGGEQRRCVVVARDAGGYRDAGAG